MKLDKFPFDSNTIELVKNLKHNEPEKFFDSFYKNLEFGTGGMRGIMGLGPNRINKYTLGKNTQGIPITLIKKVSSISQ